MAPNCGKSLAMRTFQMAALDDSVLDELTRRPLKVLICKEHGPLPKASISSDSLNLKHSTAAPKPAMAGLHRSFMGEQGKDTPLSISTAAHLASSKSHGSLNSGSSSANAHTPEPAKSEVRSMSTTTLPKFRNGRFTVDPSTSFLTSDSIAALHAAAEDAQDPTKDDDSYRTIPFHHRDYGYTEGATSAKEQEDNKQERVFTLKGSNTTTASTTVVTTLHCTTLTCFSKRPKMYPNAQNAITFISTPGTCMVEEHKLVGMAFQSRLVDQSSSKDDSLEVDDDEWGITPADDYSH
ncbi:hypothetical protein BGW39_000661, partial [Mortierella sp. 14UC]